MTTLTSLRLACTFACLTLLPSWAFALAATAEQTKPLPLGATVPALTARSLDNRPVDLTAELRGHSTLLIVFRGGWCPFCVKHLSALGEIADELNVAGVQIVAVSTDAPASLQAFSAEKHVAYRLFSDRDNTVAGPLGLSFAVPAETAAKYQSRKIDLPTLAAAPHTPWLPIPAAYLIDRELTVRFVHTDPNFKERIAVADLLAAARALHPAAP